MLHRRPCAYNLTPSRSCGEMYGLYLDALRGRCTACTDHEVSGHYVEVMAALEDLRRIKSANTLDEAEAERRRKLLDKGELDPFEPVSVGGGVP